MLISQIQNDLILQDINFIISIKVITADQWGKGDHNQSIFLSQFHQRSVGEVRMNLYLKSYWLYFAEGEQLSEQLSIKIGNPQMLDITLRDAQLHLSPEILQGFMVELPQIICIHIGPVQVEDVEIFQLHQLKGLLYLSLNAFSFQIENFR